MRLEYLLRRSVQESPDRCAVSHGSDRVTYRELWAKAMSIAAHLKSASVERGDRVLIYTAKSMNTVAAMQGVLLIGAVYVPIDSRMPATRAKSIAEDCKPKTVVVDEMTAGILSSEIDEYALSEVDTTAPVWHDEPIIDGADDLAYILYTSGSTGRPKGVAITHGNALAFVEWAVDKLDVVATDRFSSHAPFTFDLSVLDIYGAMSRAASVHLIDTDYAYSPRRLVEFIDEKRITIWYSVPSALLMMAEQGGLFNQAAPVGLRALLVAGEPCPISLLRDIRDWTSARLLNLYGPTETNVCTFHEVTVADLQRDVPPPIGRACSGDTTYVETADRMITDPGTEGELVVSGPTVMPGYWGCEPHRGPYRTGDVIRIRDDKAYDYVGRLDHMVKVRGHRVELGEVETVILAHPDVDEVVVSVEGVGPDARLVAHVRSCRKFGLLTLKAFCAERLPRYMIPDRLQHIDDFPRTFNGKVDRKALRAT